VDLLVRLYDATDRHDQAAAYRRTLEESKKQKS
jgi:hypothetical protein